MVRRSDAVSRKAYNMSRNCTSGTVAAAMVVMWASSHAVAQERVPAAGGDIVITALAHASVQVEHGGVVIHVDPWSGADLSKAKPASLVLVTDDDDGAHHLDVRALARVRQPGAPVVIPAAGRAKVPDGTVLANGASTTLAGVRVEAIAAYDLKLGEPSHPKGDANGYIVVLGGKRMFFAGVTECVPEIQALRDIDVAFMPMNLPLERMTPPAVAECVTTFKPRVVIPYHFDQGYIARRAGRAEAPAPTLPTIATLTSLLAASGIPVRQLPWYPEGPAR